MAVNSINIEALWKQYSEEGAKRDISVVQFSYDFPEPQHMLELRVMAKKGLDAYKKSRYRDDLCYKGFRSN